MYIATSQLLILLNETGLSLSEVPQVFVSLVKAFLNVHAFVVRC
jgi:hypothetical protein